MSPSPIYRFLGLVWLAIAGVLVTPVPSIPAHIEIHRQLSLSVVSHFYPSFGQKGSGEVSDIPPRLKYATWVGNPAVLLITKSCPASYIFQRIVYLVQHNYAENKHVDLEGRAWAYSSVRGLAKIYTGVFERRVVERALKKLVDEEILLKKAADRRDRPTWYGLGPEWIDLQHPVSPNSDTPLSLSPHRDTLSPNGDSKLEVSSCTTEIENQEWVTLKCYYQKSDGEGYTFVVRELKDAQDLIGKEITTSTKAGGIYRTPPITRIELPTGGIIREAS